MRKLLAALMCLLLLSNAAAAPDDPATALSWPRTHQLDGNTILIYQPQIEKWEADQLEARAAVSLTPAGKTDAQFGVVWISARTDIDKSARLVTLDQIKVTSASFPDDKDNERKYQHLIDKALPDVAADVPLDHLEANLAVAEATKKARSVAVKNDPPRIIFATTPSILIPIDGEPALRRVPGMRALRVINTRALILLDHDSKQYFLYLMHRWAAAKSLDGPWAAATKVPDMFDTIRDGLAQSESIDLLEPDNPLGAMADLPAIFVSSKPAELIQALGEAQYTPIDGTDLLYMSNTDSAVFMTTGGEYYALVSGRWFQAKSLDGPWAYVPGKSLPSDFAKIPADHPKANVLVSVPGTPQANEALIANSIPQTATVNIAQATLTMSYDGAPRFKPIDGADGLKYAENSALPVVLVSETKTYYCVSDAVWFVAKSPRGPWSVAKSVPAIIYTIPATCPIHYITYVSIYNVTPEVVFCGYTPGYMGTCVSDDDVVVYGTGYDYPAYVNDDVWYGYPPTYGYGAGFACDYATGFAFGFAAGAIIGGAWCDPYWGPCAGYGRVDINTCSVYRNWEGGVTFARGRYSLDAANGTTMAQRGTVAFNPYTGRASVGGYSRYTDWGNGDINWKRGGATYNPRTGAISVGGREISGNLNTGDIGVDRAGVRYNPRTGVGIAVKDGDVYAGREGNVYRRSNGGWESHGGGGWQPVGPSFAPMQPSFNAQFNARGMGQQRFQGYQNSGGNFRGGGGFRGRR